MEGEITAWNVTLRRRISPSMRARLDMASVWRNALEIAAAKLAVWDESKAASVSRPGDTPCPFTAADVTSDRPDIPAAAARIRELLAATSR